MEGCRCEGGSGEDAGVKWECGRMQVWGVSGEGCRCGGGSVEGRTGTGVEVCRCGGSRWEECGRVQAWRGNAEGCRCGIYKKVWRDAGVKVEV